MDSSRESNWEELKSIAQNQREPGTYKAARILSIYVTRLLLRTPITPNGVTFFWLICLLGASVAYAVGSYPFVLIATFFVFLSYVFDCVDGEIARLKSQTSKIGCQLEQIVHWFTNGTLLLGITFGIYHQSGNETVWALGALSIIGDYTFHFLYYQLNYSFNRQLDYGFLHTFTRWLYFLMPINTNLIIIGGLTNQLLLVLIAWSVISHLSWILVFSLYYRAEVNNLNIEKSQEAQMTVAQD